MSSSPFTESCLPCTSRNVCGQIGLTTNMHRILFEHRVVSDSSKLQLLLTNVYPANLIVRISYVSFRVDIDAIHIHQDRVRAMYIDLMSVHFHQSRTSRCEQRSHCPGVQFGILLLQVVGIDVQVD